MGKPKKQKGCVSQKALADESSSIFVVRLRCLQYTYDAQFEVDPLLKRRSRKHDPKAWINNDEERSHIMFTRDTASDSNIRGKSSMKNKFGSPEIRPWGFFPHTNFGSINYIHFCFYSNFGSRIYKTVVAESIEIKSLLVGKD